MFNLPPLSSDSGPKSQHSDSRDKLRAIRFVSDMILNDPDAPEGVKTVIRIMDARCDIVDLIQDRMVSPAIAENGMSLEQKKEILEYLLLVKAGIESFIQEQLPSESK